MSESRRRPGGRALAVVDGALALCLLSVPLVFSTGLRSFAAAKLAALELLVGAAALALALADARPSGPLPRAFGLACVYVLLTILLNPGPDGLAAALQRVAWLLLVVLLWWRARAPGSRLRPPWLALWIAAPLLVNVSYSLAQAAGVGVLEATRAAFGGAHGRLVGTVGNPSENGWYLALATCLLWGWARRDPRLRARPWIAWALAAMSLGALAVIVLAGARAAALALAVAGLCWLLRPGRRRSLRGLLGLGLAGGALAWGLARGGAAALAGRGYLAQLGARMLAGAHGLPRGPGAYARDVAGAQAALLRERPALARWYSQIEHAHCDGLELLLEYGAPVVLAIAALIVALLPALAAAAPLTLLGYPLYEPVSSVIIAVVVAVTLAAPRPDAPPPVMTPARGWARIAWGLAGLGLMAGAGLQLASERAVTTALAALERGDADAGRRASERAVARWPGADARFVHGNFALLAGRPEAARASLSRSYALRPRPETAQNLAIVAEACGDPEAAARWRATARALRGIE